MKKARGFTLVELLVVVGIIALLIVLLLPVLGRARDNAKNAKCQSNLHQLGIALSAYSAQHGVVIASVGVVGHWWYSPEFGSANLDWPEALVIEGDVKSTSAGAMYSAWGSGHGIFLCPSHDPSLQNNSGTPNNINPDDSSATYDPTQKANIFGNGVGTGYDGYGLAAQVQGISLANVNPAHIMACDANSDMGNGDLGDCTAGKVELGPADYCRSIVRRNYSEFQRHLGTNLYRIPTTAGSNVNFPNDPGGVVQRDGHGANYLMGGGQVEWNAEYGHICATTSGANRAPPLDIWQHP